MGRPITPCALTSLLLAHGNTINKSHPRVDIFQQVLAADRADVTAVDGIAAVAVLFFARLEMDVDISHVSSLMKDRRRQRPARLHEEKWAGHDGAQVVLSKGYGILKPRVTFLLIASGGQ
jgi:hypothetical protein